MTQYDWLDDAGDEPNNLRSARKGYSKASKGSHGLKQGLVQATIIATFGRHCLAHDAEHKLWQVFTKKGKKHEVAVGDHIVLSPNGEQQAWVEEITPRRNLVYRSDEFKSKLFAANLDRVLLVLAESPPYSNDLVCRTVVACAVENIPLLIIFNKTDLVENLPAALEKLSHLLPQHTEVLPISLRTAPDEARTELHALLNNSTTLVLGQSGMGKSTLVNLLVPDAAIATAEISTALNTGKHTTTATQMHWLPEGGAIIDSPGFQIFGLAHLNEQQVHNAFEDIMELSTHCRFNNCRHNQEPDCAVRQAVSDGVVSESRLGLFIELLRP
jgi:ribosome biogenesis GTPase